MTRRRLLLPAWLIALLCIAAALVAAGHGALSPPPVHAGRVALLRWAEARDAPTILMSITRVGALILDAYLVLTTVAGSLARAMRWTSAVRVADCVSLPSVRRLLAATIGTAVLSLPLATPGFATTPSAVATLATGPPLLRRLGPPAPGAAPRVAPRPAPRVAAGPVPRATPPTASPRLSGSAGPTSPAPTVWLVRPGDNFWSIAARLAPRAEVAPYWRAFIAANRSRLVTGDPDFILPGQMFVIPPPPAR